MKINKLFAKIILIIFIFSLFLPLILNFTFKTENRSFTQNSLPALIIDTEFDLINSFLQTTTETEIKQSYDLYLNRVQKIRRKKEIIIRKVYEITPIIGEVLALANVEKINLIVNRFFIMRETDLLRKYITMLDARSENILHSAKVLLNLLLCNSKFNRLRCILNLLMEGLCKGDERSLRIFKEIIQTVIIDTILKTKFHYFNDLQAKFNLVRVFNIPFHFKPIVKIQFVEKMMISDKLKEIITTIILNLKSNVEIDVELDFNLHQKSPEIIANNTKLFEFLPGTKNALASLSQEEKQNNMNSEIEKAFNNKNADEDDKYKNANANEAVKNNNNYNNSNNNAPMRTMSHVEAKEILNNLKTYTNYNFTSVSFSFKEKVLLENESHDRENLYNYSEIKLIDPQHLDYPKPQKLKLSEIKEQIRNEYTDFLYNNTFEFMPNLEEVLPHFQIGIMDRTIYPKYKKHIFNLIRLNELLDEFPLKTPKGSVDVASGNRVYKEVKKTTITKEVAPGVSVTMQFKEKDNINNNVNKISNVFRFKSQNLLKSNLESESKFKSSSHTTTKEDNFADESFQQLLGHNYNKDNSEHNNNYNSDESENENDGDNYNNHDEAPNNNNYNKPDNYINPIDNIIDHSKDSPEIKEIINNSSKGKIKIIYPKEIHSSYQVNKKGMKTVEINKDNPTKKLIIDKLLSETDYEDFINQQEKSKVRDPTGLYMVLKNIQMRKCSCGFLCIEIGTIYGDFDSLKPKNVSIPFNKNQNVHMIIKPIVVVNNTQDSVPFGPITPNYDVNMTDLFMEDEDCDVLKLSGNYEQTSVKKNQQNSNNNKFRFKQFNKGVAVKRQNIKRKFYRKVAVGGEVYSRETFKQGLNLIIVQRDKQYTKLYERTFDTNNNRKESDEMAEILQNTPCSKIIIITGIGKWMGAMTPILIKEIKQVGGPDLNNLYSPDHDDNSQTDHAFILVGRRGLCRYNGIFRVKNYDISQKLAKFFTDLSSDPNDCFFDDVSLENQKNRNSEKQFFHLIDLRLTLNINNDNRFAWDAPTVANVSPYRGSIHGGQEIKIGGFNFGMATTDIKEILVFGVVCGDFIHLSPNLLSCVTRGSTILGPGIGNVLIKMRNGYESPKRTCNVYEYVGDKNEVLGDLQQTIKTVNKMQNLPVYLNSNYHDQDISLFDHLMFNQAHYKKKLVPDHTNHVAVKINNMVKSNYHQLIGVVNTPKNVLMPITEGFRKRRFRGIVGNLENCDEKK